MTQGSYLLLAPEMRAQAQDGTELGRIVEVAADEVADIFRGVVLSTAAFLPHLVFVPGQHIVSVINDIATLDLTRADLPNLEAVSDHAVRS